jgi:predicted transcriptional regulator
MDSAILERIGLTHGEIKAYLALLRLGSSTAGGVSKQAGVSRSKIYMIMDNLEKKGLASHVDKRGVRHFQPVEPSKITDYLKERKEELETLEMDFQKFLPQLEVYHKDAQKGHHVTVYQGLKGLKVAHEHIYLKLRKGDEYYVLGVPVTAHWKAIDNWWVKDHKRRAAAGIGCRLLFNAGSDERVVASRNKTPLCQARYMPNDVRTPSEIEVYKDTTLIIMISEDPVSIEIVSQEIADSFRAYFEQFWKRSKPMER